MVTVVSRDGNYLLNIGSKGDGGVSAGTVNVLNGLASWMAEVNGMPAVLPNGVHRRVGVRSGKALDGGGSTSDGAGMQQRTDNGSHQQQWAVTAARCWTTATPKPRGARSSSGPPTADHRRGGP